MSERREALIRMLAWEGYQRSGPKKKQEIDDAETRGRRGREQGWFGRQGYGPKSGGEPARGRQAAALQRAKAPASEGGRYNGKS